MQAGHGASAIVGLILVFALLLVDFPEGRERSRLTATAHQSRCVVDNRGYPSDKPRPRKEAYMCDEAGTVYALRHGQERLPGKRGPIFVNVDVVDCRALWRTGSDRCLILWKDVEGMTKRIYVKVGESVENGGEELDTSLAPTGVHRSLEDMIQGTEQRGLRAQAAEWEKDPRVEHYSPDALDQLSNHFEDKAYAALPDGAREHRTADLMTYLQNVVEDPSSDPEELDEAKKVLTNFEMARDIQDTAALELRKSYAPYTYDDPYEFPSKTTPPQNTFTPPESAPEVNPSDNKGWWRGKSDWFSYTQRVGINCAWILSWTLDESEYKKRCKE